MAFALRSDGINDYISVSVSNDGDVIEIVSNIQFDPGTIGADRKIIAFNPAGTAFYGLGVQGARLRIFARGNDGQFTQVSSSATVDTGLFIEAKWRFEKLTGKASVFVDGLETTSTNASNLTHDATLSATAIMSNEGNENLPCLAKDFVFMDSATPANSIDFSFDKSSGTTVTDSINSIVGTLINYPTDNSQWENLGGGVTVTPDTLNSLSVSLDPVITFNSVLSLTPLTVNSNSIALDPTITFAASLELTPNTVNSSSVILDPVVQFGGTLDLTPSVLNTLSVALNPSIEFTSSLVVAPQTLNSSSISINPLIEFKSVINLTPDTLNTLSISLNPTITTGAVQTIGTVTAGFADDLYSVKYKLSGITVNFKE